MAPLEIVRAAKARSLPPLSNSTPDRVFFRGRGL